MERPVLGRGQRTTDKIGLFACLVSAALLTGCNQSFVDRERMGFADGLAEAKTFFVAPRPGAGAGLGGDRTSSSLTLVAVIKALSDLGYQTVSDRQNADLIVLAQLDKRVDAGEHRTAIRRTSRMARVENYIGSASGSLTSGVNFNGRREHGGRGHRGGSQRFFGSIGHPAFAGSTLHANDLESLPTNHSTLTLLIRDAATKTELWTGQTSAPIKNEIPQEELITVLVQRLIADLEPIAVATNRTTAPDD